MHEHDKIAQRLGMLLTRLYSGEKLHLSDLATEYNVTVRTLQRDFNQRLSYLPIEHRSQQYWLDPEFLNHKSDGKVRKLAERQGEITKPRDFKGLRRWLFFELRSLVT